jgi:hypothetical protein
MPTSSPHKTNPQRFSLELKWVKAILTWVLMLCRYLCCQVQKIFCNIKHWLQRLPPVIKLLAVSILIFVILIIVLFFLPLQSRFEGNLRATALSFAYAGQESHLFLKDLDNLKEIDLKGSQSQPLTLIGQFSSTDLTLNIKLSKLKKISIQLPYANSHIILTSKSLKNQQSKLAIPALRINPNSQIDSLSYRPQPAQMSFCLESIAAPQACLTPESSQPSIQSIGSLTLQPGQEKIHMVLGNFKSPQLGTLDELAFDFLPNTDDLQLEILSPSQLFLDLPDPLQLKPKEPPTKFDPIWGDLDVKNVQFLEYKSNPTNVADEQKISTILEGKVRMGSQIIDLQADQFLTIQPIEPGISKIRYIRPNPKAPYGLSVSFAGTSKTIGAGLDPKFPVQEIKLSWVSQWPQELISAFLSILVAFITVQLTQLLPKQPEK